MSQEEKTKKRPGDNREPQEESRKKAERERRSKKHKDILEDLQDVIGETEKQRQKGRKGGQ